MKVLDLQCAHGHGFEGWFASEDDFQGQLTQGLVQCPLCGDTTVLKKLSAPRLNLGAKPPALPAPSAEASGAAGQEAAVAGSTSLAATTDHAGPMALPAPMQRAWLEAVRHVMAHTEDVGNRFAEEARRIHYGEAAERGIRGHTTPDEARELLEEGIEVVPLPVPAALKGSVQ